MNRTQRRALVSSNVKLYTEQEVRAMVRKSNEDVMKKLADSYCAIMTLTLRDCLKFGHVRSKRFIEHFTTLCNDLQDGLLTVDDIKQTVTEEVGVIIK
jgi:hypothetical protein